MEPKYKIGDMLWRATWDVSTTSVPCPDCGGTGRLRVTFHDETTASIECRNCARGYEPPTGRVLCYDRKARAECMPITGMEITSEGVVYRSGSTSGWYNLPEADVFTTKEAAQARAEQIAAQADEEERQKIFTKEKDTRTWAWNASYHRTRVKQAQKDVDYHTAKLNVAALKAKEPPPVESGPK